MSNIDSVVATFELHIQVEKAISELQLTGFDMKTLSIVGKGCQSEQNVIGYYSAGDRMKYGGKNGAFWGGMWGLLFGSAVFMIPGVGPLVAAGRNEGDVALHCNSNSVGTTLGRLVRGK